MTSLFSLLSIAESYIIIRIKERSIYNRKKIIPAPQAKRPVCRNRKEIWMTKDKLTQVLAALDQKYGIVKENFPHEADWQLLIAIMLSAQSTDEQVCKVLPDLWARFSSLKQMAAASEEEIGNLIRTVGLYQIKARNIKRCCNQILEEYGGKVPITIEQLLTLSGVGRKTATLFLADAYQIPGVTVDTHVFRIARRLGWAVGKNPEKVELELMEVLPKEHWNRINFQLIYHGRSICTARKCECSRCFLGELCDKIIEFDKK